MIRLLTFPLFWLLLISSLVKKKGKKGKKQHQQTAGQKMQVAQSDVYNLYDHALETIDLTDLDFRVWLIRADLGNIRAEGVVDTINWQDEPGSSVMTGDVTFQEPSFGSPLNVHDGHQLRMDVRWGGKWVEIWLLRLSEGKHGLQGSWSFQLSDDGAFLQQSLDDWHYVKSKKHGRPHGWKAHQIVRDVAKRYRIPLGKVAAGTHWITDLSEDETSPMAIIQKAYAIERGATGKRYVIRWDNGKLNILPLRRNPILYMLSKLILDATIGYEDRDANFATAVTVRSTVNQKGSKSKKKEKIEVLYTNDRQIAREGFIHKNISGSGVHSTSEARAKAKRYIADHGFRKRTIEGLQHVGIPFLRRGDAIQLKLEDYGFKGSQGICFITAISWSLTGGIFTMSVDVAFDDPFPADTVRKHKDKKKRDDKRKKRKRKTKA